MYQKHTIKLVVQGVTDSETKQYSFSVHQYHDPKRKTILLLIWQSTQKYTTIFIMMGLMVLVLNIL